MTDPMNVDPNKTDKVTLLGRFFGKIQRAPQPPAGLEDRLSYTTQPGSNGTDAAYWAEGRIPDIDSGYFPTVYQQDRLLTHWDRPPADENPQDWYEDRNLWTVQQRKIENIEGTPETGSTSKPSEPAPDPRWNPPDVRRPTAFLIPTNGYSMVRPFDQTSEHELNGVHLSLADNKRAYMLGGSVGRVPQWNNSYRVDPMSNDASATFVGDTVNDVPVTILYANNRNSSPRGAYRL